jgi:Tfp pilus assembly protein PilV
MRFCSVSRNEKGTSLIEVLIALMLTAIVFTGLLQTSIVAMNTNVDNLLRDEAVSIAAQQMNEARDTSFAALVTGATVTVARDFRGMTSFPFRTTRTVAGLDANNKQVTVQVTWNRRGINYNHSIATVVRQ